MEDLTGQKFGRLTVLQYEYFKLYKNSTKHYYWRCKCECGNEKIVNANNLKRGKIKSCGCLNIEKIKQRKIKHGKAKTRLYTIWLGMKLRCNNINCLSYKRYGNRGITVCQEWFDNFMSFHDWAYKNGYNEDAKKGQCTLDRIDVNGNYEPNNCRWVNMKVQANNRRNNHYITYNNETHTIMEWSRKTNINFSTIIYRLNKGLTIGKVLGFEKVADANI